MLDYKSQISEKVDVVIPIGNSSPNFPIALEVANSIYIKSNKKPILDLFSLYVPPSQGNEIPIFYEKIFNKKSLSSKYLNSFKNPLKVNNPNHLNFKIEKFWAINKLKSLKKQNKNLDILDLLEIVDPFCLEGIESTITSRYRILDIRLLKPKIIERYLLSWLISYKYIIRKYCNIKPNFHIWNGRFCKMTAVRAAARDINSEVNFFELSDSLNAYTHEKYSPHDKKNKSKNYISSLKYAKKELLNEIDKELSLRTQGKSSIYTSQFIIKSNKKVDSIKNDFILILPSSEDEYAIIKSWHGFTDEWQDAFSFVEKLTNIKTNYDIVVRLHPNMTRKNKTLTEKWIQKKWPDNFRIFLPDSNIDSYSLVKQSSLILGDASTIMYESAFLRKPIKFFNSWLLDNYFEEFNLRTFESIVEFIQKNDFSVNDEELKKIYRSYFLGSYNERIPFKLSKFKDPFHCIFNGKEVQTLDPLTKLIKTLFINLRKKNLKIKRL